jgi:hypothetical protein
VRSHLVVTRIDIVFGAGLTCGPLQDAFSAGVEMVTAMHTADGTAAWRRLGRDVLCADRSVDLLRVNSALCTGMCRSLSRG